MDAETLLLVAVATNDLPAVEDALEKGAEIDVDAVAQRGLNYERLDQLTIEHLLGVRG